MGLWWFKMDFGFTKKQLLIKDMITRFVEKEVKPFAADVDQKEIFPAKQIKKLAGLGIIGMSIPKKYGGAELDAVSQTIIMDLH